MTQESFERFKAFIEPNLGIKIPPSKKVMLEARLAKRIRALKLGSYEEYCDYVFSPEGFDREIQQLIDVVTTNETDFFREAQHYTLLKDSILPELVLHKKISPVNIWSVAASTGQEAYTLAMVFEEFCRAHAPVPYSILGTDISETVLKVATTGIYTEHQAEKIPRDLMRRYCLKSKKAEQKTIRIKPDIRSKIRFRKLNLMEDHYPVGKKYHIIFCRNVFIYFDRPNQRRILAELYSHLSPGGYLFMGHSENIGSTDLPLKSVSAAVYRNTQGAE
ncbi:MAG TPA: CheR family methyltransferase [Treponemataceae bacterium]|jgi:chemotaxis protein methyltransferase CheR|nr:MAG: chemotaxis protein CheR [Treponema sp.]HOC28639.1 CheR family methyltransferase [Treponemataceae bacterium]HPX47078.1 CheR family methyltransferase [Treponemataceae bacterium]HQL32914.1 CheR family methyltransferase [Treponemataceae bacterium]